MNEHEVRQTLKVKTTIPRFTLHSPQPFKILIFIRTLCMNYKTLSPAELHLSCAELHLCYDYTFRGNDIQKKIPDIVIGIKSFAKYIALKWPILLTFYPFFQKVLDCKLRKKSLII